MGAAIAMFSIVDAVLLKRLPYPQANRLAWIATTGWGNGLEFVVSPECAEWSKTTTAFEHMVAMPQGFDFAGLTGAGEPSRIGAARVTANFFDTFRVYPMLGRPFNPSDNVPARRMSRFLATGFGCDSSAHIDWCVLREPESLRHDAGYVVALTVDLNSPSDYIMELSPYGRSESK